MKTHFKNVRIGIATESPIDVKILYSLIEKIIEKNFPDLVLKELKPKIGLLDTNGRITAKKIGEIKEHFSIYTRETRIRLIVICTDNDEGRGTPTNELSQEISNAGFKEKVILIKPHENIEGWLIRDIRAVNLALSSNHQRISDRELAKAKNILNQWIGDARLTEEEGKLAITGLINITNLKAEEFIKFNNEIIKKIREIIEDCKMEQTKKPKIVRKIKLKQHIIKNKKRIKKGIHKKSNKQFDIRKRKRFRKGERGGDGQKWRQR